MKKVHKFIILGSLFCNDADIDAAPQDFSRWQTISVGGILGKDFIRLTGNVCSIVVRPAYLTQCWL